ncbi:MAG: 3-dehydroquinate synthase [Bacteroidales bacterium]|nr:3-dehydroquinate synthase [Bacteroidales bacterium]
MNPYSASLFFDQDALADFQQLLRVFKQKRQKIFVLLDDNTRLYCWPLIQSYCAEMQDDIALIVIPHGEENKNIDQLQIIWKQLTKAGAAKDGVLINLGGGVITDLGGFAAASYKRGITTIHFPTTLLAMVDASLGGKTGIDFEGYKNHIGSFYQPLRVYILTKFLKTLPEKQWKSGLGELIKYSFLTGKDLSLIENFSSDRNQHLQKVITDAALFKLKVVAEDPMENGYRKILNFGHTIGHAFESFAMSSGKTLMHGEAVAAGIIAELFLSVDLKGLKKSVLEEYISFYQKHFEPFQISPSEISALVDIIAHDKKNRGGDLLMVCIDRHHMPVFDVSVEPELLRKCLRWYSELF